MSLARRKRKYGSTSGTTSSLPTCSSVRQQFFFRFDIVSLIVNQGHPVSKFVPSDVPKEKLALLGAATDW